MMADFIDLGEYFRRLPRARFDQASFKINLDRLTDYVSRYGISDDDLMKFFSLWLGLNIPLSKWLSIGRCMVPDVRVPAPVVDRAMKWIFANYQQDKVSHSAFVLSWLSGLVEYNLVDEDVLSKYYELFFMLLDECKYRSHVVRLVYHLTRPEDVARWRVIHLVNSVKGTYCSKSLNELHVILWHFKSLRPDLVPENIPFKSPQTVFPKLHPVLIQRFTEARARRQYCGIQYESKLTWSVSTFLGEKARGPNELPIIPDLESGAIASLASDSSASEDETKSCINFNSKVDLLQSFLRSDIVLPPSILTLMCNEGGLLLLAFTDSRNHRILSNSLYHTLSQCFLQIDSNHSHEEKNDFLGRIYYLECVLLQGIPIVSQFLFEYLVIWNGNDHFHNIMDLLQWVVFGDFTELSICVLTPLETLFLCEDVYYRCSVLKMLRKMYTNIHFANTKRHNLFLPKNVKCNFPEALSGLCSFVDRLCGKSLRCFPDSMVLQLSFLDFYSTAAELQSCDEPTTWTVVPQILTYSCLCSPSPLMIDTLLAMMMRYRAIYKRIRYKMDSKLLQSRSLVVEAYKEDFQNCLWLDMAIRLRNRGLLFKNLSEESANDLRSDLMDPDSAFSISSHMAFAVNTYMYALAKTISVNLVEKEFWIKISFYDDFPNIVKFVSMIDAASDTANFKNLIHRRLSGISG